MRPPAALRRAAGAALIALSALAAPASPAEAWRAASHLVIAQIAYDRLSEDSRTEADRLIAILADFEPRRDSFVSASLWLDDVRAQGWSAFDRWHYINLPFNDGGLGELPPAKTDNAVEAIERALETLAGEQASDLAKAFSLRVLIHVVGDVHQPLHCVSRYTPDRPEGDRGGNDFELAEDNLHFFWDRAGGLFDQRLGPESSSGQIASAAAEVLARVPEAALPARWQLDPHEWAREGHRLAVTVAYVGIAEGRSPSEVYRTRVQLVAQRRLVMAGYRLAAVLEKAFGEGPRSRE
ncbi:MAG: S1/P1 nuclease [Acidobacteriota bacterium]